MVYSGKAGMTESLTSFDAKWSQSRLFSAECFKVCTYMCVSSSITSAAKCPPMDVYSMRGTIDRAVVVKSIN